ncbi:MAG: (Fe-S)-binding protein, partial [Actinobacteria bacterium]|nr:(Fe-S)-binding protein [Actinomycetota bacterium]
MNIDKYTVKQLLNIEACTRCGRCTETCSAYSADKDLDISPAKKIELLKKRIRSRSFLGKIRGMRAFTEKEIMTLAKAAYECTLCSRCETDCPVNIDLKSLWISLRADLAAEGRNPEVLMALKDRLKSSHNISFDTNRERIEWIDNSFNFPEKRYVRTKAAVAYFVGCVSSFLPGVFKIPRSVIRIFNIAKVDFTLLGNEEWCCGFPLLSSGYKNEFAEFAGHNIEKVNNTGAGCLVTSCPSCYHMWAHIYKELHPAVMMNFKIMH